MPLTSLFCAASFARLPDIAPFAHHVLLNSKKRSHEKCFFSDNSNCFAQARFARPRLVDLRTPSSSGVWMLPSDNNKCAGCRLCAVSWRLLSSARIGLLRSGIESNPGVQPILKLKDDGSPPPPCFDFLRGSCTRPECKYMHVRMAWSRARELAASSPVRREMPVTVREAGRPEGIKQAWLDIAKKKPDAELGLLLCLPKFVGVRAEVACEEIRDWLALTRSFVAGRARLAKPEECAACTWCRFVGVPRDLDLHVWKQHVVGPQEAAQALMVAQLKAKAEAMLELLRKAYVDSPWKPEPHKSEPSKPRAAKRARKRGPGGERGASQARRGRQGRTCCRERRGQLGHNAASGSPRGTRTR